MVGFWIRGAQGAVKGVNALSKIKGQKTVGQVKLDAAKSKLKMTKDALKETFKKTDESLEKLKKTTDRIKWYQKAANKKRYSDDFYKGKK